MWRLDRLKDEEKQIEQTVRELIYHTPIYADVMKVSCTRLYQTARQIIGNPGGVQEEEIQPELEVAVRARTPYQVTSCCCALLIFRVTLAPLRLSLRDQPRPGYGPLGALDAGGLLAGVPIIVVWRGHAPPR